MLVVHNEEWKAIWFKEVYFFKMNKQNTKGRQNVNLEGSDEGMTG